MGEILRAAAGYYRVAGASDIVYSTRVIRSRANERGQPVAHPREVTLPGCTATCPNRDRCDGKPWRLPRSRALKTVPAVLSIRVLNAIR